MPDILRKLNVSIAITTYQAGKLIFISPGSEGRLTQLSRTFAKPMGLAVTEAGNRLGLATRSEILVFQNSHELAKHYPQKSDTYDALYMPRASYFTNPLDIHDLAWVGEELFAVNTLFSCIVKVDSRFSFTPVWKPSFITRLASEDRCHLNGMTVTDGEISFATAFSQTNGKQGWREHILETGCLINVQTQEIICNDLAMPHSPRFINGKVLVCLSATGQVIEVDPKTGDREELIRLKGFLRGMTHYDDFLFVGHSKLRKSSSTFGKIDLPEKDLLAGVYIVHLPSRELVGQIDYHTSVEEIYDVQVIPGFIRPNILNTSTEDYTFGLSTPGSTYWAKHNQKEDRDEKAKQ